MGQHTRCWYLSHWQAVKAQTSMCLRAVSLEPSLLEHIKFGFWGRIKRVLRSLVTLVVSARVFKESVLRICYIIPKPQVLVCILITALIDARSSESNQWPISIRVQLNLCIRALSKRQKIGFQDQLSLDAGQKYCRMLQWGAFCNTFYLHL